MLGQVHGKRASDGEREIKCRLVPGAVINDRTVDPSLGDPGLGRGEIGEPRAVAEAEHTDFACAFAAPAQLGHRGDDVGNADLLDFRFGAEHGIALGGVKIGDRLPLPFGLCQKHDTRPVPAFRQREASGYRRHFAFGCHSPSMAPVGSTMIENEPAFGTSVTSRMTVAPRDLALAVAAAMSSTRTYASQSEGAPGTGCFIMPPPVPSPTPIIV